jgi:hypothetical protein
LWYGLSVDPSLRQPFLDEVTAVYAEVKTVLDERQRRLLLGAVAQRLGRGGIKQVAAAVGVDRDTVSQGVKGLRAGPVADGRVRVAGAGRPSITRSVPGVVEALEQLVEPVTRGDPESPLRWTNKSTTKLAEQLTRQGFAVAAGTVGKLLKTCGYRLQANTKVIEGRQHPDRDAQFEYVNDQAVRFLAAGDPVISIDAKKREQVGNFKNGGREWEPVGASAEVNAHDFPSDAVGVALPYGVYDMGANTGWVNVGTDHDTAVFAAESVRRWWRHVGADCYPEATRLLITADSGGSNGSRLRLWKAELARFADETGLAVTVVHLPPGTSKWNKIEHRLFSHISMNWRGRPLESHEVVVNTIAATTTRTGLSVKAVLDDNTYPTGLRITDAQMRHLLDRHIRRHEFHPDWNYDVVPTADDDDEALVTPIIPTRPKKRK